jgi:hypothetical protein
MERFKFVANEKKLGNQLKEQRNGMMFSINFGV